MAKKGESKKSSWNLLQSIERLFKDKKQSKKIKIIFALILSSIILLLIFGNTIVKLLLYPIAIFIGFYSTLSSKFVPHITLETMSISAIVSGILYGPSYGFSLGFVSALVVYILLGMIKLTTLTNAVVIGSGGIISGILRTISPFPLYQTFAIAIFIRAIIGICVFWNITSDKIEALAHAIIDPVFNIFIYMPFFYQILLVLK